MLPLVHLPSPQALKGPTATRAHSSQRHGLGFTSHPCESAFLYPGEGFWMLHLISSKFSRDVLGTDGQNSFCCGRNGPIADTNTSKHNVTCHLVTIFGEIGITQNPTGEGKPLLHSPHPRKEGIAHKSGE